MWMSRNPGKSVRPLRSIAGEDGGAVSDESKTRATRPSSIRTLVGPVVPSVKTMRALRSNTASLMNANARDSRRGHSCKALIVTRN